MQIKHLGNIINIELKYTFKFVPTNTTVINNNQKYLIEQYTVHTIF